ncbi:MAG: NnrS family protein [Burkholderiaceae bacterium]|nr:NnrS family protein [Burkholderiaceae bacterium]
MSRTLPLHVHTPAASPARAPTPPLPQSALAWRPGRLLSAPHRLAFAAGTAVMLLVALWWAGALLARAAGGAGPAGLPASTLHALLMGFGFMPLFFTGFLFTAGPRWLGMPPPAMRHLRGPVQAQAAGALVLGLAGFAHDPALARLLAALGLAALAAGWGRAVLHFARLLLRSTATDKLHASVVTVAGALGAVLMVVAAGSVAAGDLAAVHETVRVALWAFAGVVYAAVAHRMIPFFSAAAVPALDAWRPPWLLASFVMVLGFEGFVHWAPVPLALQAAIEAAAGLGWTLLALRWGLLHSLRNRLLAMLHLGFVWLGVAMGLAAVSHGLQAAGQPGLGLAPLHAYTMGFLGSTLVAMVTRVSAGHSGRSLAVDTGAWVLFWVLQAAVIGRIMSDIAQLPWLTWAAVTWAAALLPWGLRHLAWYGRPRVDGRPG